MKTRYDAETLADQTSPKTRSIRGAIRRMVIKATKRALWQLEGHRIQGTVESPEAEVFSGVGFYSRPAASSRAEAVLLSIGDAQHPVIVATRDEDLRKLWKADLDANPDVAAMFNRATIVLVKADNTVEIRSRTGVAVSLAPVAELQRLYGAIVAAIAAVTLAGGVTAPAALNALNALKTALDALVPAWPAGTTILKAE